MGAAAAAEYVGASALVRAAVPVTGQCLTEYTPAQLGLVFSSLASMDTVLPGEWLVRFYEYSRPQVHTHTHTHTHTHCCTACNPKTQMQTMRSAVGAI